MEVQGEATISVGCCEMIGRNHVGGLSRPALTSESLLDKVKLMVNDDRVILGRFGLDTA
jgi:hypothetical protein